MYISYGVRANPNREFFIRQISAQSHFFNRDSFPRPSVLQYGLKSVITGSWRLHSVFRPDDAGRDHIGISVAVTAHGRFQSTF
ncbi:hypothetical protein ABT115_27825 [Streptomyces sp. NPDC001832]|uniref:hypothetical protein n=1 Tax=Streptomyces sp. NPDC001832 TaxID=3154527 RepID=UPI00333317A6